VKNADGHGIVQEQNKLQDDPCNFNGMDDSLVEICGTDDRIVLDPAEDRETEETLWKRFTKWTYNTQWKKKWWYDLGRKGYFFDLIIIPKKVPWTFGND